MYPTLKNVKEIVDQALAFIARKISDEAQSLAKSWDKSTDRLANEFKSIAVGQTKAFSTVATRFEVAVKKIQNPVFSGEISVDTTEFVEEIQKLTEEIRDLVETTRPDMKPLEMGLRMMLNKLDEVNDGRIVTALETLAKALDAKKLEVPATFKLDQNQFRALSNVGRGSMRTSGALQARGITQTNLALTSTAAEYSYTFPANTVSWQIKLRDQGTLAYYSFATGKLPTVGGGGDGSKYTTIPQNFVRSQDGVEWGGKTIYLGAESASQVAEIEAYTA